MTTATLDTDRHPFRFDRPGIIMTGMVIAFGILFFQATQYLGLMERLAEWQFSRFDRYFPALTILILTAICALVVGIILDLLRRRAARTETVDPLTRERLLTVRWWRVFAVVAGIGAVMTLSAFVHFLRLPDGSGAVRLSDLGAAQPGPLVEGRMQLTGSRLVGPISRSTDDVLFVRSSSYFAPARRIRGNDNIPTFDLFIEVTGEQAQARGLPATNSGILRFSAMPPDIVALYRHAGYDVADRSAILFRSVSSARRAGVLLMTQFLAFSLIALVFAAILRRRERRLDREAAAA